MEQPMITYVETPLVRYYTCLRCECIFLSNEWVNHHNCVHITTDTYSDDETDYETDYETEDTDDTDTDDTDDDTDTDETDQE